MGGGNGVPPGCAKKVAVEDFGVFFVTPLGIPSDLHGHLPGENLTGKFSFLKILKFSGLGPVPGPVGSSTAITGLYRILAITLAIR